MTDKTILSAENFYTSLGENYDLMIGAKTQWNENRDQFETLLEGFHPQRILDAGCGTGGESIFLGQRGFDVSGVDLSTKLINIAREKAGSNLSNVNFEVDDLRHLATCESDAFDLIVCRGNTLPHLLNASDLKSALQALKRVINSEGLLILQWINYPLTLKESQRLIGVTGNDDRAFVRFYDFISKDLVMYNILQLNLADKLKTEWLSTELRTWSGDDVGMLMVESGWNNIEISCDLERSDFDPDNSPNIVIFATG